MDPSESFVSALRAGVAKRTRSVLDRKERAAVLVAVVQDAAPLRLILTRRTEGLPTHRGQVAFPGGHVVAGDDDLFGTALREAREEIGLPPERVDRIGLLDDRITRDGMVAVTPCVGVVEVLPPLRPSAGEVARVFTIPIEALADAARWRREVWQLGGKSVPVDFFDHEGEVLWGLSARIVRDLLAVAGGAEK